MIPDSTVQQIKDAAKIADVIGQFVTLKRQGSRLAARCPFHDEKTPSFYITPAKNMYKCFGCGIGGDAVHFLEQYRKMTYPEALDYLAAMYNISADTTDSRPAQRYTTPPAPAAPPPPPPSYVPKDVLRATLKRYEENNFALFLIGKFGTEVAANLIGKYIVGTAKDRKNIFWQIDSGGHVRGGKVMQYDPATGKRDRKVNPTWTHTLKKMEGFNLCQCWYGEHLLSTRPGVPVAIVESEKTAMIASLYFPGMVWIAAGGKGIQDEKWPPLKGRRIVLFPDASLPDEKKGKTPYQLWSERAAALQKEGYKVTISDLLERRATTEQRAAGYDLADYLLPYDLTEFIARQTPPPTPTAPNTTAPAPMPAPRAEPPTAPYNGPEAATWQPVRINGATVEIKMTPDNYPALWDDPRPAPEAITANVRYNATALCEAAGWFKTGDWQPWTAKDEAAYLRIMERHNAAQDAAGLIVNNN
jgi:hypothetical protein